MNELTHCAGCDRFIAVEAYERHILRCGTINRFCAALLAGALLLPSAALAGGLRIDTRCYRGSCSTEVYEPGPGLGKAVEVPMAQDPDRDARIAKWELYCQPKLTVDDLGVSRYRYLHAGCEYGRSE